MKINFIKLLYEEENDMKKNKGITLVALVVTIVVLLILAGVSINLVLGNNGIIAKAKDAQRESAEASQNDLKGMNGLIEQMESTLNGSGNGGKTEPETVPYLPSDDFHYDTSTSVDTGLVIKDASGNEYVWVVVPRTTAVYATTGLGKTTFTDADYTSIENDLKEYTKTYRGNTDFSDVYYPDDKNVGWFADATAYNNLKNSMLKSVYENGGFYVGRYEAGIDTTTGTNRTSNTDKNSDGKYTIEGMPAPVSKADAYPYTYVTRTQAQNLASNVNSGTKTSSLMFGVQWDLVLAFMHNKGNIADSTLTSNSTTIGNYKDNSWTIKNANAKYSDNKGRTFTACPNPFKKESNSSILLTTGADSSFSVQNIYDVAGNVWEWILENTSSTDLPCASRGGCFSSTGSDSPTIYFIVPTDGSNYSHGFRVSLF
jgi:type II secretory pathway pseudopilin PulG